MRDRLLGQAHDMAWHQLTPEEAVSWFRLVAAQGDADAQVNLENMYAEGRSRST